MDERNNLPQLPKGWTWTRLGDILDRVEKTDPRIRSEKEFDYLDIASIDNTQQKITNPKKYFGKDAPSRARQVVKVGDILFSTVRTYLKNIAVVPSAYDGQIASTGFCVIRPSGGINSTLYFLLAQTNDFLNPLNELQRGTSYPAVRDSDVFSQFVPVPPLPEQRRIVAKIEELFSDLDAGIAALKETQAQLKRYRQAVLKAAVEGKLTAEWRVQNASKIEPASELLERIRAERAKNANGKAKALPRVDATELGALPEGWCWVNVADIGEVVTGTTPSKSKAKYYGSDFPFFKPADLNAGYYVRNATDNLSMKGIQEARLLPPRSILVTCIGATIGKIGFSRIGGASNQQINAIIPYKNVLPEFIYFVSISPQFQKSILVNASATTLPILNKGKFETLPVPIPSSAEQQQIVAEVERRLSVADEVERTVDASLRQAERLQQSILKRAFAGKLVPQDPNDEPAERLVERIRAARDLTGITKSVRSGKHRATQSQRKKSR